MHVALLVMDRSFLKFEIFPDLEYRNVTVVFISGLRNVLFSSCCWD